jgi:hypothetical protein
MISGAHIVVSSKNVEAHRAFSATSSVSTRWMQATVG